MLQLGPRSDAVGVTHGDGAVGIALSQPAVSIADGVLFLGAALALFGFQRDLDVADVDFHVNAFPIGLLSLLPGVQPTATEQLGQPDVQRVFMFNVSQDSPPYIL